MYACPNCGHHMFETDSRFTRRVIVTGEPYGAPTEEEVGQSEGACYGPLTCCRCGQTYNANQVEYAQSSGRLPLLTQEEYRTNDRAEQCPQCHQEDYIPGKLSVEGVQVVQARWCNQCGMAWSAVFRIAGYIRQGYEETDTDALYGVWCVETTPPEEPTACVTGMCVNDATCPRQLHCRKHACECPED